MKIALLVGFVVLAGGCTSVFAPDEFRVDVGVFDGETGTDSSMYGQIFDKSTGDFHGHMLSVGVTYYNWDKRNANSGKLDRLNPHGH